MRLCLPFLGTGTHFLRYFYNFIVCKKKIIYLQPKQKRSYHEKNIDYITTRWDDGCDGI